MSTGLIIFELDPLDDKSYRPSQSLEWFIVEMSSKYET